MLRLVFHGGKCCGVKTIYGFDDNSPTHKEPTLAAKPFVEHDITSKHVNSDLDYFTLAAPEETTEQRLDRYIDFLKSHRPQGIVEIVLGTFWMKNQKDVWGELLEKRGFKLVNENLNSNSENMIYIYHLNLNEPVDEDY